MRLTADWRYVEKMKSIADPLIFRRSGFSAGNRIVLAAMTNKQSNEDGTLSDDELNWLTSRADGGFGIITTCAAHVAKDGQGWPGELGIFDDVHLDGLTRLATELHDHGAGCLVQIFHGGVRADRTVSGVQPWSASEHDGARAATEEDLTRVITQFADAAVRAEQAGFDGVEIHGAHGYLFTQFLSNSQNRRTDQWGGSIENRARLLREATRAIRARVSRHFTVGVRISPEDFGNAKGLDLDESIEVARWLVEDGIDFVHLSLWRSANNTTKRPSEHAVKLYRGALPADVVLMVAGAVWTREEAESLLAMGGDAVAIARAAILNPDWPLRALEAGWEPKRPPATIDELLGRGLNERFAGYMRAWKGFVE